MAGGRSLPLLDYAVAARSFDGVSGDRALVHDDGGDRVLIAVADGLGHGEQAGHAASLAIDVLAAGPIRSPCELVVDCHRALAGTRGAVLALAVVDAANGMMTWLGVGNVEGRLIRAAAPSGASTCHSLMLTGGIVGHHLPRLHPAVIAVNRGDMLAFATDGIDPRFDEELLPAFRPQPAAERILACCDKGIDDALVLVGHWIGRSDRR